MAWSVWTRLLQGAQTDTHHEVSDMLEAKSNQMNNLHQTLYNIGEVRLMVWLLQLSAGCCMRTNVSCTALTIQGGWVGGVLMTQPAAAVQLTRHVQTMQVHDHCVPLTCNLGLFTVRVCWPCAPSVSVAAVVLAPKSWLAST